MKIAKFEQKIPKTLSFMKNGSYAHPVTKKGLTTYAQIMLYATNHPEGFGWTQLLRDFNKKDSEGKPVSGGYWQQFAKDMLSVGLLEKDGHNFKPTQTTSDYLSFWRIAHRDINTKLINSDDMVVKALLSYEFNANADGNYQITDESVLNDFAERYSIDLSKVYFC